ncbi:MAG: tRNA lysidine(34) synthetase TilS [Gemmobacter sp.]
MPVGDDADSWPLDRGEDAILLLSAAYAFPYTDRHVGVAVSGGGDSVALLHLMVRAYRHWGAPISAVTVDHQLRAGSAEEAARVAALCATLDVPHTTLVWEHGKIAGNLMDAARRARMERIAAWARTSGITQVVLGHTQDDQAETFLMALSRAAGLDGLAGMRHSWRRDGIHWTRPLMRHTRYELRDYLQRHGLSWVDDPTNDDARFERTRARRVMAALAPLGIDANRIGMSASHLASAQWALEWALQRAVDDHVTEVAGALRIDGEGFRRLSGELRRQMMVKAVARVSGNPAPMRWTKQFNLLEAMRGGRGATVHGCRLLCRGDHFLLTREHSAVADLSAPTDALWDKRWLLTGPHAPDLAVRALGPLGLPQVKGWRALGIPREALLVTPAVWDGDTLLAAPVAGLENGWKAHIATPFHRFLVSD